jgi:hypothetical protein
LAKGHVALECPTLIRNKDDEEIHDKIR